jgi:hypothetical protein
MINVRRCEDNGIIDLVDYHGICMPMLFVISLGDKTEMGCNAAKFFNHEKDSLDSACRNQLIVCCCDYITVSSGAF